MNGSLEVLATGPLVLVQDEGRHGHLAVGVGRAGAADLASYRLGGRVVANVSGAPALEVTFGGLRVRAWGDLTVALTGAPVPATVEGRPVPMASPLHLRDGEELALGTPSVGLRTYLSARGGIDVPLVLGSASTDTMSGLGPAPVRPGDILRVGTTVAGLPHVESIPLSAPHPHREPLELTVLPGPRRDWFAEPGALAGLWTVSGQSDRKGLRLEGEALQRVTERRDAEVPSEGMVRGALQVPPNGQPVLFLNDHPVTGGYPVIGVVRSPDIDIAGQLRPGEAVRLRWA